MKKDKLYTPQEKELKSRALTKRLLLILMILVVVVSAFGFGYMKYNHYYQLLEKLPQISSKSAKQDVEIEENPQEKELREKLEKANRMSVLNHEDVTNILVIGVDSRERTFEGRSDAMIVVSINQRTKQILMTSLLRDIYVLIPNHRSNKLNSAYAEGGAELLKETIQNNFGIQIDKCIAINFYFVSDLVDALGGIDIEVTKEELQVMNHYIHDQNVESFHVDPQIDQLDESKDGLLHLNGNQALAYSRNRYIGTDFERTNRQRKVIMKCIDRVKKLTLVELDQLAEKMLPKIATDLSQNDLATLMLVMVNINHYQMKTMAIPIEGTYQELRVGGMSSIGMDFQRNREAWNLAVEEGIVPTPLPTPKPSAIPKQS